MIRRITEMMIKKILEKKRKSRIKRKKRHKNKK
jgi:hypothetical protein